jgi:tellurite methyltransferase
VYHRYVLTLQEQFGEIDIYLFDQILRGHIGPGMRIFDAGCGTGRNLIYFLREGYEVFGVDTNPMAVSAVQSLAARLGPGLPAGNFRVEGVEATNFPAALADVAVASALLHFARDVDHFHAMLNGIWRVLKPGGLFFCRLSSTIGMERRVEPIAPRRYRLPGGAEWFLVDDAMLRELEERLGGRRIDPLKTTVVEDQRAMTTWVLRKLAR